jgi:small subunit ribosomal protein S29
VYGLGEKADKIGRELTDAHAEYSPLPESNPVQFVQQTETARLLARIAEANQHVLSKLTLSTSHSLPIAYDPSSTLYQFAMLGAATPEIAWTVFAGLWSELTAKNDSTIAKYGARPPILFTADNISHFFVPTLYQVLGKDDSLQAIHPFDLLLPKLFVDHVSGKRTLPNGGMVLGAMSASDFRPCRALEIGVSLALAKQKALEQGENAPDVTRFWNQLERIDQRVLDELTDINVLELKGVSKEQAKNMIEYWAMNGLVRNIVTPMFVSEKWTLSGGGVVGELENSIVSRCLRI